MSSARVCGSTRHNWLSGTEKCLNHFTLSRSGEIFSFIGGFGNLLIGFGKLTPPQFFKYIAITANVHVH